MTYIIKHVATERELDDALAFDKKVFGVSSEQCSPAYAREKWLERMGLFGDLMLFAESGGEIVGIVFGRVERKGGITVGPVAMDERFRKRGIAREMMLLLEKRALGHGIRHLGLGAMESAEGFYEKLGYTGSLLLQSERHSIEELLALNTKYQVIQTNVYDGTVNQVFLELPMADREFQRYCERTLPGCGTQMVYGKTIKKEEYMKENIGNYARHAQYWDWSNLDHDRTADDDYWYRYAKRYGNNVLIPMCALGETGAYMARRGMTVTAFDITPQMIAQGKKRFGDVPGLRLCVGDVTDFRFDIPPADFCYSVDFGHLLTIGDVKKALAYINYHLRDGGGLVIETTLPPMQSHSYPLRTFEPAHQVYPGLKVWKTGEGRFDAETGRHYISQKLYAQDEGGHTESFDHAFYLQSYSREQWIQALGECGYDIVGEYRNREVESWQSGGDGFWMVEAVKTDRDKTHFAPAVSIDHLQTGVLRHGDVTLYNDCISLEFPNSGYIPSFQFGIFAEGQHVGSISVRIGYAIRYHYSGQIGYEIKEEFRGRGYATKACLALRPFLRQYGFQRVLLTTDEHNAASRRVCEKIGAGLLETVDTPTWTNLYKQGQRRTCRYEWEVDTEEQQNASYMNLRHVKIDVETDKDYILEQHCRVNYECDCPWARQVPYDEYRANWFANPAQQSGFLSALVNSMEDARTIAEIIRTESGEIIAYLWVPFHGEDSAFTWADVQDIYVEGAYRGIGIATYLMDYAEKVAKQNGAKVIRSGTGCENVHSQGLHRKTGYYQYRMEYEKILEEKR